MRASDHPEYEPEYQHLTGTLRAIEQEIASKSTAIPPYIHTPAQIKRNNVYLADVLTHVNALHDACLQAYVGRVDWLAEEGETTETFYIGRVCIRTQNVFSWADTLAADLYYTGHSSREKGTRLLKRVFRIQQANLHDISDEYVAPELRNQLDQAQFADSLLLTLLRDTRGHQLHDIVATIQAQQYQIITTPLDRLLVIQGVPGSGKTSIALHRVAYLLYHHRDSLKRVLILGSNKLFLAYTATVLPSLGERRIPQRTFDAWILEQMPDTNVAYDDHHELLEILLDPTRSQSEKIQQFRTARTKGSLTMATLLDRYTDVLHDEWVHTKLHGYQEQETLVCRYVHADLAPVEVRRSFDVIKTLFNSTSVRRLPLNQRRAALETHLIINAFREKGSYQ